MRNLLELNDAENDSLDRTVTAQALRTINKWNLMWEKRILKSFLL